jgi:hypothetical protein
MEASTLRGIQQDEVLASVPDTVFAPISVFFGPPADVVRRVQGLVRVLAPEGVAGDPDAPIP